MSRWTAARGRSVLYAAVLIHVVFGALVTLRSAGLLQSAELGAFDIFMGLLRSGPPQASQDRIHVLAITEPDIARYGWPLSDELVARLLERLVARGARVIALDLFRDRAVPPGEDRLAAVLRDHPQIVGAFKFPDPAGLGVAGPTAISDSARLGFVDVVLDPDGVVRRGLLFLDDGERVSYSLALRLALLYLEPLGIGLAPEKTDLSHVRLGDTIFKPLQADDGGYVGLDTAGYQILLNYFLGSQDFPTLSVENVLGDAQGLDAIRGKIVIIGSVAESVKDRFYTPFSRPASGKNVISGVSLHGHIASDILARAFGEGKPIRTWSDAFEVLWIWVWCLFGGMAPLLLKSAWRLGVGAALGSLALAAATFLAFRLSLWIPAVPPAIGGLTSLALVVGVLSQLERVQRTTLMRLFSAYVSPTVADVLWSQRDQYLEGGKPRPQLLTATVLFLDLQGFTGISERTEPQHLVTWLNEILESMAELVSAHDGIVDKFSGDGLMAVFGVPIPRKDEAGVADDARNAARCALAMSSKLLELNAHWQRSGQPTAKMRIGIDTGPLIAGSVGSRHRMQYTVVGDTANTASRLESQAKTLTGPNSDGDHCTILVSDITYKYLGGGFDAEPIGDLRLRGKSRPTKVYRLAVPSRPVSRDVKGGSNV